MTKFSNSINSTSAGVQYTNSSGIWSGVSSVDYGVLISSSTGVPEWLANGTTGKVLTATTSGTPSWESPSGIVTLDADSGSATGSTVTISGGTTGLTTSASSATMDLTGTLIVGNGGTGVATMTTAYAPVCAGTTATGALQVASTGLSTSGYVLTSNGSSSLPSFQAAPGANGFTTVNVQTFASSGTYTPTSNMVYCIVECVGAGGGGGGGTAAGLVSGCGGGGGGSYVRGFYSASSIGSSQTVTIGAVGSAGSTSGGNGGTGGSTLFGSLITAVGGSGGTGSSSTSPYVLAGGAGGTGSSGGSFQTSGMPGLNGVGLQGTQLSAGSGGSSFFGGGALGAILQSGGHSNGTNGVSYGGGGSGGCTNQGTAVSGGTGAKGFIVVTEFIS